MLKLYSKLLQLSAQDIRVFGNDVEELDTDMMPASSMIQNCSHQVFGKIWIRSMHFIVMNQRNHQYNEGASLRKITSNQGFFLPKTTLWFQLSWGDLIIMPLIMVMLSFTLHSFQLIITMNWFHTQTPLRLIISWNYFIQNMMKIFWILTSRCFKLDWWYPLLQNFVLDLLCCFIKFEEQILSSQMACHTFLCLYRLRPLWNWLMETHDIPKE